MIDLDLQALTQTDSTEGIVQALLITPVDAPTGSAQVEDEFEQDYLERKAVKPPHNMKACVTALDFSPRLAKLIRTMARNTVGLGWYIDLAGLERDPDGILIAPEVRKEIDTITKFFMFANPEMSFTELMERVIIDKETTGNGYIEVVRAMGRGGRGGVPVALYHVPALSIRVLPHGQGFVQVRESYQTINPKKVFFKRFGDTRVMNKHTGEFDDSTPLADRATEIIHRKIHHPASEWYGIPRWLSAAPAILMNRKVQVWNLNFVQNDAAWPVAIVAENAELSADSQRMLKEMIERQGKGVSGAGRVLILQANKKHPAQRGTDTRIRVEKLAMGLQDDGSFLELQRKNEEEIRETFGIGALFLGSAADLNRASAAVSRLVTNEQEFVPEILNEEYALNVTLMRALGAKHTVFRFRRPRVTDDLQAAQILTRTGVTSVMTVNEIRRFLNRVIPDLNLAMIEDEWANKPPDVFALEASKSPEYQGFSQLARREAQRLMDLLAEHTEAMELQAQNGQKI